MGQSLSNQAWSVTLVGRTSTRATLRRWMTEAAQGDLRIASVTGPAGIGKSRMVAWASDSFRRDGGRVWLARCSPQSPPFAPIAAILGDDWPTAAEGTAENAVRVTSSFDRPALSLVRALVGAVTQAAATGPLLFALDDVHWADDGTLALIEQLAYVLAARAATARCPVAIILAHRPLDADAPAGSTVARIRRESAFRSLVLEPLDEVEVHELLRRLTSSPPDRRLVQRVHEASGGNPLLAIAAADAAFTSPQTALPRLNPTVDDVMGQRLGMLTPLARRLVLSLAVHVEPVPLDHLPALAGMKADECGAAVGELDSAHLVAFPDAACELASPHVAEAVVARASPSERQAAHGCVATALRAAGAARTTGGLLALAHHLEQAGPAGAAELGALAPRAADGAFAAGAWGWASRLYEVAIEHRRGRAGPASGGLAGLHEKAGIACFHDFDRGRCEEHLEEAIRLADADGNRRMAARAALWLVRRRFTSGTDAIGRWVDVTPVEKVSTDETLPTDLRALAHGLLAENAFQANDLGRASEHVVEAQTLAGEAGDDFVAFWVGLSEGLAHMGTLALDAAAHAFLRADRSARRAGRSFVWSLAATRLALTDMQRGDLGGAYPTARRSAADAETTANWAEHALAHTALAIIGAARGQFGEQEDHGELAEISGGRSSNTFAPLVLHPSMAWGRAVRGDRDGAEAALAALDAAGGRSGRYRAGLPLLADDPDWFADELATFTWRSFPAALTTYDAGAHAAQLEIAIAAGRHAEVSEGAALFADAYGRGLRFVLEWPALVPRLLADAMVCLGRLEEAGRWLDRAEAAATAAGSPYELARVELGRAALLLADDTVDGDSSLRAAVALIDNATERFDRMGLLPAARRAQRLFDRPSRGPTATRKLRPRAVLFTDIVDSTAWNAQLGDDQWLVLLAHHNHVARGEVRRRRGIVVKTTGDGICAWFAEARDAVDAAVALQRSIGEFSRAHPRTPLLIRCGVALGDVFDFDGDLAGLAVTEAARICAEAGASQVLVSDAVRRRDTRPSYRYRDVGPRLMKGLPEAAALFAIEGASSD